jgi:hypothetical protein
MTTPDNPDPGKDPYTAFDSRESISRLFQGESPSATGPMRLSRDLAMRLGASEINLRRPRSPQRISCCC